MRSGSARCSPPRWWLGYSRCRPRGGRSSGVFGPRQPVVAGIAEYGRPRCRALAAQLPAVRSARPVPAGDLLTVQVPHGCRAADLEAGAEVLAAALEVRELRVSRDHDNARLASVLVVRLDPFAAKGPITWPAVGAEQMSLWQPVPAGVAETGEQVGVLLPERHLLLGGEPGASKSTALSLLVAGAALDPQVDLWLLDGKLVELATWARISRFSVGPDLCFARLPEGGRISPGSTTPWLITDSDQSGFHQLSAIPF